MAKTLYTLSVYVTVDHDDEGTPDYSDREIERELFKLLSKRNVIYGADIDLELMETATVEDK